MSVSICQTATPEDFLLLGELLAAAVAGLDRRVVLLASGGLSHRFWPLRELRRHESADLANIVSPEARAADERLIAQFAAGDHAAVLDGMEGFRRHAPEGFFGHYLMMAGALGGSACQAPGRLYSDYEAAAGTGQAHVWFDRPARRLAGLRATAAPAGHPEAESLRATRERRLGVASPATHAYPPARTEQQPQQTRGGFHEIRQRVREGMPRR